MSDGHHEYNEMAARIARLEDETRRLRSQLVERERLGDMARKFQFVANTSRDFMTMVNRDRVYEAANLSYCYARGLDLEQVVGSHMRQVWGDEVFESVIDPCLERCFEGEEVDYDEWFEFFDAKPGYYHVTYYPYRAKGQDVTHAVIVSRDYTERKRLEDGWRKYEFIANSTRDFMSLVDREYRYEAVNGAYLRVFNRTRDEIVGRTLAEVWGEETFYARIKPLFDQCLRGIEVKFEDWFDFHSEGRGYYEVVYNPYYNERGVVTHVAVSSHNLTLRKRAEMELRAAYDEMETRVERRTRELRASNDSLRREIAVRERVERELRSQQSLLASVMDSIPALISYKSPDGKYVGCNEAFESFTGVGVEKACGRVDAELFDARTAETFGRHDMEIMASRMPYAYEAPLTNARGEERAFQIFKTPYHATRAPLDKTANQARSNACSPPAREASPEAWRRAPNADDRTQSANGAGNGALDETTGKGAPEELLGIVSVGHDITERKKAEALREDVERMSRHDLKSPLNVILGVPDVVAEEGGLNERQRELLGIIEDAGYRMLNMINLSLDLFKMETGAYEFNPAPVDLMAVLKRTMREQIEAWRGFDSSIRLIDPEGRDVTENVDKPVMVMGEELLCHTLAGNLLTNALEASPRGGEVVVRVEYVDENFARVCFHNQGEVPEPVRVNMFEKYATHGKESGTGLGAYSARLIALTHGGETGFVTSREEGTTVWASLPRGRETS